MRGRFSRMLAAVVASAALVAASVVPASAASGPAGDVFAMVNQQRQANGLPALVTDPTLDHAAQTWAEYLGRTNTFQHSSSQWRADMISGAGWINSGENIAAGYSSASSVMSAWMGSPGHRANILGSSYVGVGVGYIYIPGSQYGHYWVQIFANSQPRVSPGAAPTLSGTPAIGQLITATTSGWPSGTSLSWTWSTNGAPIPGASSASYKPTLSDTGRTITATVTGNRAGYFPTSRTSTASPSIAGRPASQRISGSDRYRTAVAISQAGFGSGAPIVYVASGENFPDALAAAPAASLLGGPLLLTPSSALPSVVRSELLRLDPDRIVVVGGTGVVSDEVLEQLESIAPSERIAGDDRFATSRAIVADAFDGSTIAYLATGLNFPDALTAGAAAAKVDAPVVLIDGSSTQVGAETLTLLADLGVTTVRLAGSSATVSAGIQSQLSSEGFTVERAGGIDRFETAVAVNKTAFTSAPTVYLALATNFPDALAGATLAGSVGAPLFISFGGCLPASIERGITALSPSTIVLLGSQASLNGDVATFLRC